MYLGIDLGTSNSAIAAYLGSQLRLIKTADGTDVLPSALYVDPRGHRFVGRRAYEQAALDPDSVAREFKRLMGTSTPLRLAKGSLTLTPEEASAEILRALVTQAGVELGSEPIEGSVVTIPAAFNQMQTEATLQAAELAGLSPVSLLHEPIAAALASMANSDVRTGQFLVYDLGGGTFDVALVQSSGGSVNIIAHEGKNMLGGKDFDKLLMDQVVCPWLEAHFQLGDHYRQDPGFAKMLARTRLRAEQAKIDLSSRESTSLYVSDDELRLRDQAGRDIFIEVEFTRRQLEELVSQRVDDSIALCRKVISDNGLTPGDLDRVVLIGGPSKMPIVRNRVPEALGIPADLATDPMTAVALGAAIFAESRTWSGGQGRQKATRGTATAESGINVRYDYPSRVPDDRARLVVRTEENPSGWRIRVDAFNGWTSGDQDLDARTAIELPLADAGENRFRGILTGPGHAPQQTDFSITRTRAASAGVPATHTVAVAVEEDRGGERVEVLDPLVAKGTLLPATGSRRFRAFRELSGGTDEFLDFRLYEAPQGVEDPSLALHIGSFRLDGRQHLQSGDVIRRGDEICVDWTMSDSGTLDAKLSLPERQLIFDMGKFFSPKTGHHDFDDPESALLAQEHLSVARQTLQKVEEALGDCEDARLAALQERHRQQVTNLAHAAGPDDRRAAVEEAMSIRQDLSLIMKDPRNRAAILNREIAEIEEMFERLSVTPVVENRFGQLAETARQLIDRRELEAAQASVDQMRSIVSRELASLPEFVAAQFLYFAEQKFLALDPVIHDRLTTKGHAAMEREDIGELRRVISTMLDNMIRPGGSQPSTSQLAGIMKWN
jgi:molecular chaperone DnaK